MSAPRRRPSDRRSTRTLEERVYDLERRTRVNAAASRGGDPDSPLLEQTFSGGGAFTTRVSGRWYPPRRGLLGEVVASLETAGSTGTVVTVYINGSSVGTVLLATGVHVTSALFDELIEPGDYVTVAATGVGTGAEDLSVQVRVS